jgi:23S rRNA (cytosine1962-C5)-methyltransferase
VREGHVGTRWIRYRGQKTGLFLDQRENRVAAAQYARGRLLDTFSYNGGFALALAPQCDEVLAVDISEDAVARIRLNAERNGLSNVQARAMNVFDELRELERRGERFDTIVLDPPAFAKNKAAVRRRCRATRRSTCGR